MRRFGKARYLLTVALICILFAGLFGSQIASAAEAEEENGSPVLLGQEEPISGETLDIYSRFPILQSTAGTGFKFEVTLFYEGDDPRTFDLDMDLPEGWQGIFVGGYPETEISAFTVEPGKEREAITMLVIPTSEGIVEPDNYTFTVRAASDELEDSLDLEGIVVSPPLQYSLYMFTATMATQFQASPDQDNHVSLQLTNAQSGTVDNIALSAEAPEGWDVVFTPATIKSLEPGVTQEIDMVIIPPAGTEAGDYPVFINAASDQTETNRDLRITVRGSTNWGVGGVIAVVAAVVVLAIWFRKSGTR